MKPHVSGRQAFVNDTEVSEGHGVSLRIAEFLFNLVAQVVKQGSRRCHKQVVDMYRTDRQDLVS